MTRSWFQIYLTIALLIGIYLPAVYVALVGAFG